MRFPLSACVVMGLCWLVSACGPSHAGRTVGKGVLQVEGGLGGPMVKNLGGAIPIPNIPLGARYGVAPRLDVSAHLNLLPLIMGGFLSFDSGLTVGIVQHKGHNGPNLATGLGFAFLTDFDTDARFSPIVDLAGGYTWDWITPFLGAEMIVDLWDKKVITNLSAGVELDIKNTTVSAAAVWFCPSCDTYASSIEYVTPAYYGAIGVVLGVKVRLQSKCIEGRK